MREAAFAGAAYAPMTLLRDLTLGPLFTQNLGLLGQTRGRMVECHGAAAYDETARWAEAIHRCHLGLHGLAWMSRHQDRETAMVLFGDRVDEADFEVGAPVPLDGGPGRRRIGDMAARFGLDTIP